MLKEDNLKQIPCFMAFMLIGLLAFAGPTDAGGFLSDLANAVGPGTGTALDQSNQSLDKAVAESRKGFSGGTLAPSLLNQSMTCVTPAISCALPRPGLIGTACFCALAGGENVTGSVH
jgi:hypothetical protein